MSKTLPTITIMLLWVATMSAQEPIDVTDQTIKIGGKKEEELYFGFAAGDKILFNFQEANDKELKEVEIVEYPSSSKFSDYKTVSIKNKSIAVVKQGVYIFRFKNSALSGRVCKIKIQRIPKSSETINFSTGIKWEEQLDTTYDIKTETVTTGYNTVVRQKTRRVLATVDTNVVQVFDRVERVHSTTNLSNSNVQLITFELPTDTYLPHVFKPYKATETVSWAYAISVGESGTTWYKDANSKAAAKSASNLAVKAGMVSTGYGALALLAIEGLSAFSSPPQGDNIKFQIYKDQTPIAHSGNSVAASGREVAQKQGVYTIRLENDNFSDGINVAVKVVAVTITKTWKDEEYTETEQEPIKEKKTYKIPKVTKIKVPVLEETE